MLNACFLMACLSLCKRTYAMKSTLKHSILTGEAATLFTVKILKRLSSFKGIRPIWFLLLFFKFTERRIDHSMPFWNRYSLCSGWGGEEVYWRI